MKKVRTHYDNLKVARNAPPEVIRAAYRSLSLKYHPDKNPSDPEATRISMIINASYAVLSDEAKRKEHDKWIEQQEGLNFTQTDPIQSTATSRKRSQNSKKPFFVKIINVSGVILIHLVRFFWLYVIGGIIVYFSFFEDSAPPSGPKPYTKSPTEAVSPPKYTRSEFSPNGEVWPSSSSYISGYPKLHTNGLSEVTVDNTRNDSDVFVKLVSLDGAKAYPIRQFYINSHGKFTLKNIDAGRYDIRYRDLESGYLSRSESFTLEEKETYDGIQYSDLTMTLYKVQNGNMETYRLAEDEF